jgi:nicotinamidase-related amidase
MGRLLDRADSLLVVIDAQPGFYGTAHARDADRDRTHGSLAEALARAAWLAAVAAVFGIPAVVTEEDAARNGPTDPRIGDAFGHAAPVLAKHVFGVADQADIRVAIEATGRRSAVLVGLETDVCVAHSALGLLDLGYRVAVVDDATYAPGTAHAAGIRRMADAGAVIAHAKGVYYEWARDLATARAFEADHPALASPPGFDL